MPPSSAEKNLNEPCHTQANQVCENLDYLMAISLSQSMTDMQIQKHRTFSPPTNVRCQIIIKLTEVTYETLTISMPS